MKFLGVLVLLASCTKPNPNLCCIDQADCEAHGLSTGRTCEQGQVCRDNACVVESCAGPTDCDAAAPFCSDGVCAETCSTSDQCPDPTGDPANRVCAAGACVECAANADCPTSAPVCDHAACRGCATNDDCDSGLCGLDGSCVGTSDIAYVSPTGSAGASCDKLAPCALTKAIGLGRHYALLASGTYSSATTLTISASVNLVGATPRPILTTTSSDAVLTIGLGASLGLDRVEVANATTAAGIVCTAASAHLSLVESAIDHNGGGIEAHNCVISIVSSSITDNGGDGANLVDSTSTIDRSTFANNQGYGLLLDDGVYTMRNSFFTRNADGGLYVYSQHTDNVVEFNTIVDNQTGTNGSAGFSCGGSIAQSAPNNIIARNGKNLLTNTNCTLSGSFVDTSVTDLHFVSPDTAPYDYHLMHGSVAIDAATTSTLDHDFDVMPDPRAQRATSAPTRRSNYSNRSRQG